MSDTLLLSKLCAICELSTPLAFDQDFNFIAGVERSFEQADRNNDRLGVQLIDDGRLQKGEARLLAEIKRSGAIVHKAPSGISRSRENTTRWHPKKKCISWAVEWILPEGRHITRVSESDSIQNSYNRQFRQRSQYLGKKKFEQSQVAHNTESENHIKGESDQPASGELPGEEPDPHILDDEVRTFFYLHRPLVATKAKALINLDPNATLATALQGQIILEFPTIYILSSPPDDLPANYKLHTDGWEDALSHQALSAPFSQAKVEHQEPTPSFDPVKVAETIQQDLIS
ncbi:MAG: hypothetical protein Q9160_001644 [Pyrenula sp. 1 TL-2023]